MEEGNHQRKVQLFFTITLTLLDHQLFNLRQKCSPAALAADPRSDVEGMFSQIANAIKVTFPTLSCHTGLGSTVLPSLSKTHQFTV